jgi:amino acid transporter
VLALCDGLVYAHLGAALPGSGGPYLYLREAYKPLGLGEPMAFVYIFHVMLVAPLTIASGGVGFADYLRFYWTGMSGLQHDLVAGGVCVLVTAMLWRHIEDVGKLAVALLGVVFVTIGWVIVAGLFRFSPAQAFDFPPHAYQFDRDLLARLGATSLLAMYSYGGYNQVCNIGEEVRDPARTLPRSIVLSIVVVAALYMLMTVVILGLLPWQEAKDTRTIASVFIARTFADPAQGRLAALVITVLIQFVAAASLYALILGYSRVPFSAARDGLFFPVFARVHPTKHFPHVSLLVVGLSSIPFCFFSLGQLANWIIQVQVLLSFIWVCAGVILLRERRKDVPQPFTMWLYPLPAVLALVLWLFVFVSGPREGIVFAFAYLLLALLGYAALERSRRAARAG